MALARNTLLLATVDLAESLGLSRSLIYQEIQLTETVAETPNAFVPVGKIIDAMEFAAWRTQRADFGLMVADRRDHLNLGLYGLLVEQCETVLEMHEVSKQYLHLHNGGIDFDLSRSRGRAVTRLLVHEQSYYEPRHYVEALLALYVRVLGLVLGSRWRPGTVYFTHEQLGGQGGYERRFGKGCKFKQRFNGVALKPGEINRRASARDLQAKLKYENLLRELCAAGASRDFISEVGRLARLLLPSGEANVERVAELLATSTRSLQRRLLNHGTSFGELLEQTRVTMAREYFSHEGMTLNKLAPLLGFSEPSAACRFLSKKAQMRSRELKRGPPARRAPTSAR